MCISSAMSATVWAVYRPYRTHWDINSHWTMHICLKLVQVLQIAASLFVLHFVLDMPIWWQANCPCCGNWKMVMPDEIGCYSCRNDWLYWEKKWAKTTNCMLMLATKSLHDNPKWCPLLFEKCCACICIFRWEVAPIHAGECSICQSNLRSTRAHNMETIAIHWGQQGSTLGPTGIHTGANRDPHRDPQ